MLLTLCVTKSVTSLLPRAPKVSKSAVGQFDLRVWKAMEDKKVKQKKILDFL